MFQLRAVYLFLACAVFAPLLSGGDAAPRPQEDAGGAALDLEAGVEAEEKDLQGAASIGYGYYSSPYLGGYGYGGGIYGGGYWPHYSGSYYGLGEYGECVACNAMRTIAIFPLTSALFFRLSLLRRLLWTPSSSRPLRTLLLTGNRGSPHSF